MGMDVEGWYVHGLGRGCGGFGEGWRVEGVLSGSAPPRVDTLDRHEVTSKWTGNALDTVLAALWHPHCMNSYIARTQYM